MNWWRDSGSASEWSTYLSVRLSELSATLESKASVLSHLNGNNLSLPLLLLLALAARWLCGGGDGRCIRLEWLPGRLRAQSGSREVSARRQSGQFGPISANGVRRVGAR